MYETAPVPARRERWSGTMNKRNVVNALVLVLAALSVVPTLITTEHWSTVNYVTAVALAVGVVWFVVDAARTTGAGRSS